LLTAHEASSCRYADELPVRKIPMPKNDTLTNSTSFDLLNRLILK
jgi:hypothetical protein